MLFNTDPFRDFDSIFDRLGTRTGTGLAMPMDWSRLSPEAYVPPLEILSGAMIIFLNYVGAVPGGETNNAFILLGLGFILGGIITATRLR